MVKSCQSARWPPSTLCRNFCQSARSLECPEFLNAMPLFRRGVMRGASLGYAFPGTILAIGFLTP
ncbi:TPA: hypothetical protein OBP50_001535 [Escherichia coli]|nr:hypothetical protein [Escherichia coli]HCO6262992.1 hypothetical protein [Escherichia coli]HCO6298500.1 hypothetical protein [Escherichia coli]